ncbi:hypothetical protein HK101_008314 [Irineochytrium annulatum]|nr:hypothetical protein HK101_008314 [Irineochytrium annulatum]
MEMIDKRLNDKGKNWRHVYKSLVLLDYLLHYGSDSVLKYAKENMYIVKTLKEFQYIDDDGRDHGVNVRKLCKEITTLLNDDSKLKNERRNPGNRASDDFGNGTSAFERPRDYYNEDSDIQKALEESRRTAEQEQRKRLDAQKSETDLQKAIELSEKESADAEKRAPKKTDDIIDFFASPVETQPNLIASSYASTSSYSTSPFGNFGQQQQFSVADPFPAMWQQQQLEQQQLQQQIAQHQLQQSAFQQPAAPNPFGGFGNNNGITQSTSNGSLNTAGNGFGFNPYNGYEQSAAKKMSNQLSGDAGSRMIDVARNSQQIDPFASLAASRSNPVTTGFNPTPAFNGGGQASNPFAPVAAPTNNDPPAAAPVNGGFGSASTAAFGNPSSSSFGAAAPAKNPFQAGPAKFQWETSPQSGPSLSQLASNNTGGNQMGGGGMQPFGGQMGGGMGNGQQSSGQMPFGQGFNQAAQPFGQQSQPFGGVNQFQHPQNGFNQAPFGQQQQAGPFF